MGPLDTIQIVDLKINNLGSLVSALKELEYVVSVVSNGMELNQNLITFLPGTGNFASAAQALDDLSFRAPILDMAEKGAGILGVCLGSQLLLDYSEEGGGAIGLGLIQGFSSMLAFSKSESVPVLGWRKTHFPSHFTTFDLDWFYFAHSYQMKTEVEESRVGYYERHGHEEVTAMISNQRNVVGMQFHPEKSGPSGLRLLRAAIESTRI